MHWKRQRRWERGRLARILCEFDALETPETLGTRASRPHPLRI
jgi:hypothetical protein